MTRHRARLRLIIADRFGSAGAWVEAVFRLTEAEFTVCGAEAAAPVLAAEHEVRARLLRAREEVRQSAD